MRLILRVIAPLIAHPAHHKAIRRIAWGHHCKMYASSPSSSAIYKALISFSSHWHVPDCLQIKSSYYAAALFRLDLGSQDRIWACHLPTIAAQISREAVAAFLFSALFEFWGILATH